MKTLFWSNAVDKMFKFGFVIWFFMKGVEFSIRTVAMITLGLMVVALIYVSFENWFTDLVNGFISQVEFGSTS